MAGYLSPATFVTPNEWKARGPLGGFLAGMNQEIANQIVGREFAQDDADLSKKNLELADLERKQASKNAGYDLAETAAKYEKGQYDDGTKAQEDAVARGIKKAALDTATMKNEDESRTQAANLWVDMSNELKAMGGQLNPMDPTHRQWYEGWRQKMQKYAPNMPAMLDTAGAQNVLMQGQKGQQFLAMKQQAALNDRQTQIKEASASAHDARALAAQREIHGMDEASRERIATQTNETRLALEKAKQEKAQLEKKYEAAATRDVRHAKETGKIDEDALGSAEWLAEQRINDRMKVDPNFKLTMLEGGEVSESRYAALRSQVAEQILPGYMAAKTGQQPGKTVTPSAKPAAGAVGNAPAAAVEHLKKNPKLAADFDKMYGAGSAAKILGQ